MSMSVKPSDESLPERNVGGRPRDFTPERCAEETAALKKWIANPDNYYTLGFLNERELSPIHISRLCEYDSGFRSAWEKAKRIQEQRLVQKAVSRKGDPGFIKFLLIAKGGWKDETTVNHNLNPLASLLDKIAMTENQAITIEPIIDDEPTEPHQSGVVAQPSIS